MKADSPDGVPSTTGGDGNGEEHTPEVLVFVDTNVLLHGKRLDDLPLGTIVGSAERTTVVITSTVVDELDAQKTKNPNKSLRKRASGVLTDFLNQRLVGRLQLRSGASLVFETRRHGLDLTSLGLDPTIADDHVLGEILRAQREHPASRCLFLSRDAGPLLRGTSLRIETIRLDDSYCLDVPDEQDRKIRALQEEVAQLKSRQPKLAVAFSDGKAFHEIEIVRPRRLDEEAVEVRVRASADALPRMEEANTPARSGSSAIEAVMRDALRTQENLFGVSENAVAAYNLKREKWLEDLRAYYRSDWLADEELSARTISLHFTLRNGGSAAATDVQVSAAFPAGVRLSKGNPRTRRTPRAPEKPRGLLDSVNGGFFNHVLDRAMLGPSEQPNTRGPWIDDEDDRCVVRFSLTKARHQHDYPLHAFFATLPDFDEIRSFRIGVSIFAAELPVIAETSIDLKIVVTSDGVESPTPAPATGNWRKL